MKNINSISEIKLITGKGHEKPSSMQRQNYGKRVEKIKVG